MKDDDSESFTAMKSAASAVERTGRANWVIGCATDDEVRKIAAKDFEFPGMSDLVSACDKALGTAQFFQTIKKQAWKAMDSYTHSGIRQLTRRFSAGKVEPTHNDGEIKEVIDATTTTVLLQGRLFCAAVGKQKEADHVELLTLEFVPQPVDEAGNA